jgi:membrane protease YdiL (CAAX protease family)
MNNKEKILIVLLEFCLIIGAQWLILSSIENSNGIWEWIISSAVLFGIMPILTIKYFFREGLSNYFIKARNEKEGNLLLFLTSIGFFGLMTLGVVKLNWQEFIPVSRWLISGDIYLVLFIDLLLMPMVIVANEIFFRGLMMVSFAKWLGIPAGIVLQSLAAIFSTSFFLENIKDIEVEKIVILFVFNLFLGYICFKKRSIFVSAFIHWLFYLAIDSIVLYQIYGIK